MLQRCTHALLHYTESLKRNDIVAFCLEVADEDIILNYNFLHSAKAGISGITDCNVVNEEKCQTCAVTLT